MFRRMRFLFALVIVLGLTGTALAKEPATANTDPTWQAWYWNNITLSGTPVLQRNEGDLNHNWGEGSPGAGVNSDHFSARWSRSIWVTAGTYRFTATSDDGIRVWVDSDPIVNGWYDHGPVTFTADKYLSTGNHLVVVEYYENIVSATVSVNWAPASSAISNWRGEYFNNTTLSGSAAAVRDDAYINFDWGYNSPVPGVIGTDHFSVRWTQNVSLPAGTYRFTLTTDDGARLWVNNSLLIDQWRLQSATTYTGDVYLPGGVIPIKLEHYEAGGEAVAQLRWTLSGSPTPPQPIGNWRGEYFNNMTLSGGPAQIRDDAQINFDWGSGSPVPGALGADHFSVRWTRNVGLSAGTYRFTMRVDDGGRLWVNNQLLIDAWRQQAPTTYTGDIYLSGGTIPIKMEYYEYDGGALAQLSWAPASGPIPVPPSPGAVVVDDTSAGFVKGGAPAGWRTVYEGHGGRMLWTRNNDYVRAYYNWARWYPSLASGRYEVYVYIPERYTTTSRARYWVSHSGGYTLRHVNQSVNGGRWVSLGTYWFRGSRSDYVSLSDVTYEPRVTRLIGFDAVKWEPR